MSREEVWYYGHMRRKMLDIGTTGLLWLGVLMIAIPLGQLLEAIVDTVRYGHPR